MKITQIRNATLKIRYAGKTFLIDPMLSKKANCLLLDHQNFPYFQLPIT